MTNSNESETKPELEKNSRPTRSKRNTNPRKPLNFQPKSGFLWILVKFIVYTAAGFAGAFLLYRSYNLYQITFAKWDLARIGSYCTTFNATPFFGSALASACSFFANTLNGLLALVTLLALQILQVIPTFLMFHVPAIEDMILNLRFGGKDDDPIAEQKGDTADTRALIKQRKKLKEHKLQNWLWISLFAFGAEMYICYVARSSMNRLNFFDVLIDSLALDILIFLVLFFRNSLIIRPLRERRMSQTG